LTSLKDAPPPERLERTRAQEALGALNAGFAGGGAGWRALAARLRQRLRAAVPPLSLAGDVRRVPPDGPAGPVDVVVPVYGAAEALDRCLHSLAAHTDLGRHRLLLVLDGPQPAAVLALLAPRQLAALMPPSAVADADPARGAAIETLQQPERRGFVASVNRGMAASGRDVVLLNSDTRVTSGWLEKLQAAARSAPEIATVTPFSNSATICSLPRFLESNALPAGWDVDAFGRLVEERSGRARPRLPTGVGVCLYIKRKALDHLGLFDERSFGLGYGEESEFCMRALKAGYAHVLDDATFVFHEGHRSFGVSRRRRVAAAHRRLAALHPEYLSTVARFLREDPLLPLRQQVIAALLPRRRPARAGAPERVLHVVHGWPPWSPAGTEMYAAWLVRRQAERRAVTVLGRIADPGRGLGDAVELLDSGARVRLLVRNFDERDPRSRNALACRAVERDFARLLTEERPQLVHVHHLAGHAASLVGVARRRSVPVLYQIQDWWTPCARANLLDRQRRLCSGPGPAKCAACLPLTRLPPAALLNRLLYRYRAAATRSALRGAAAYVMGSRFIHDSYLQLGLLRPGDAAHVLQYGVELTPRLPRSPRRPGDPLRCGVIGSILPHKGIHVAAAAFAGIDPRQARLTIWGDPAIDAAYTRELLALGAVEGAGQAAQAAPVVLAGRFEEERKAAIFAALDLLIIPSLGLESFGLVAREAEHHGVPILASRRGALCEIFPPVPRAGGAPAPSASPASDMPAEAESYGALFAPGDAGALRGWIERLIAEPAVLAGWQSRLPPIKSADDHAEEIEDLYCRLLAGDPLAALPGESTW
jgi:GT2 family glycosyltransferase